MATFTLEGPKVDARDAFETAILQPDAKMGTVEDLAAEQIRIEVTCPSIQTQEELAALLGDKTDTVRISGGEEELAREAA